MSVLEGLAMDLAEARFGRGIYINRTPEEQRRAGSLWSKFEMACKDCDDQAAVARARQRYHSRAAYLHALWACADQR
jgi:predicted RNA-binding protein YlxR (DUF448 family)